MVILNAWLMMQKIRFIKRVRIHVLSMLMFITKFSALMAMETTHEIFKDSRHQKVEFSNPLTAQIEFDFISHYLAEMAPGERKTVESLSGHFFNDEDSGETFTTLDVRNSRDTVFSLPILQKKTIKMVAAQSVSVELPFPHYCAGLNNSPNFQWDNETEILKVQFTTDITKNTGRCHNVQPASYAELETLANIQTARFSNGYAEEDVDRAVTYIEENNIDSGFCLIYKKDQEDFFSYRVLASNDKNYTHTFSFRGGLYTQLLNKNLSNIHFRKIILHTFEPYFFGYRYCTHNQNLTNLFKKAPVLGFCRHPNVTYSQHYVLIPDPYLIDNLEQIKWQVSKSKRISKKIPEIFFRGSPSGTLFPYNKQTIQMNPRLHLLSRSKEFSYLNFRLSDDKMIACHSDPEFIAYYEKDLKQNGLDFADWNTHAHYKYLLSCDGYGAAWGRPLLIMATGGVLLMQHICDQYFHPLLQDGKTHLKINNDISNLKDIYNSLEENPAKAQEIANSGREFIKKYISKDSIETYINIIVTQISPRARMLL